MLGTWDVNVSVGGMPEKVATAVGALSGNLVGSEYTPIAYLGSQLVNGTNHAVLAEQTLVLGKDVKNIVILIFHETAEGVSLSNIERVLESGGKFGGIEINVETEDGINKTAQEVFEKAFFGYVGMRFTPFALLGTQVVRGTNFFFACEGEACYPASGKEVFLVTVNDADLEPNVVNLLEAGVKVRSEESAVTSLRLSAPWTIFFREVQALFKKDPQVTVLYNYEEPELKVQVKGNDEKAAAIGRFFPTKREFGNVVLNMSVVGNDGQPVPDINCPDVEAINKAFDGNEAVSFIKSIKTVFGDTITYVVFVPEVVQYFADNMTDIYGAISTLYQDIADDIFEDSLGATGKCFFNTEAAGEVSAYTLVGNPNVSLGKPLGEWP